MEEIKLPVTTVYKIQGVRLPGVLELQVIEYQLRNAFFSCIGVTHTLMRRPDEFAGRGLSGQDCGSQRGQAEILRSRELQDP